MRKVYGPAAVGKNTDSYHPGSPKRGSISRSRVSSPNVTVASSVSSRPSTRLLAVEGAELQPALLAGEDRLVDESDDVGVLADVARLVGHGGARADDHRQRGAKDGSPSNALEHVELSSLDGAASRLA